MKTPTTVTALPTPAAADLRQPEDTDSHLEAPALKPPAGLTKDAKQWWSSIQDEYGINDPGGLLLLKTAMQALDRLKQAQTVIRKEGPTVLDRFDQVKAHPLLTVERDSRAGMLAALRALNLDVIPNHDAPGRPGGT